MIFPLTAVYDYLVQTHPNAVMSDDEISVALDDSRIHIVVSPVNETTYDDRLVSESVSLQLTAKITGQMPVLDVNSINRHTMTCSANIDEESQLVIFITKIDIFEGDDEAALKVYAPIIAHQAATLHWHASHVLSRHFFFSNKEEAPVKTWDEPIPSLNDSLSRAKDYFEESGFCSTLGDNQLTCEFPWDEGAYTRQFSLPNIKDTLIEQGLSESEIETLGGLTSLLKIQEIENPMYGRGLLSLLILPLDGAFPDKWLEWALWLNRAEQLRHDWPPFIGSWCAGDRGVTFTSFVPTGFYVPGLAQNIAIWNMVRAFRVKELIDHFGHVLNDQSKE